MSGLTGKGGGDAPDVIAQNQTAAAGGTLTASSWNTRPINTLVKNPPDISLASNRLTLPAGDYFAIARALAYHVNDHTIRLYDVTGAAALPPVGHSGRLATSEDSGFVEIRGEFSLTEESDIELQHNCQTTRSSSGMGLGHNVGTVVNAEILLWRI